MKKRSLFVITFLLMCVFMYAAPNYNNGNGTVLSKFENNEIKTTVRKCELHVVIGDLLREEHRFIYDNYANGTIIGKLKDDDGVEVLESCTVVHLNKPKDTWGNPSGALWYKIRLHEITGWICITSTTIGSGTDPYYNNRYEIIGKIQSSGKFWTVRRMKQTVSVWEKLNVRDAPGLGGKKVFLLHDFTEETRNAQENHTIICAFQFILFNKAMKLYKLVVNKFVVSELLIINSSFKPSEEDIAISPYCWIGI